MITVSYQDILNRAAELSGRTRDKLPPSEALIFQQCLAVDLEEIWNKACWPEVMQPFLQVTPTGPPYVFSKNEGQAGEMGDVITVMSADPTVTTKARHIEFVETDGQVLLPAWKGAAVWVEYASPAPDLTDKSSGDLAAMTVPRRFRNYLALRAAAHLLAGDSQQGDMATLLMLAETALAHQQNRLPASPWWRNVRVRGSYATPCQ